MPFELPIASQALVVLGVLVLFGVVFEIRRLLEAFRDWRDPRHKGR